MSDDILFKVIPLSNKQDQVGALDEMLAHLSPDLPNDVIALLHEAIIMREETTSTYLEDGLAIPHGRIAGLDRIVIVVGVHQDGVSWPVDEDKAHLVMMIGVPQPMVSAYLRLLQKIIRWRKSSKLVVENGSVSVDAIPELTAELRKILS